MGTLATDVFPEGPLTIAARATDEDSRATDATRTLIIDRTPTLSVAAGTPFRILLLSSVSVSKSH